MKVAYNLKIIGQTWEGFEASYIYHPAFCPKTQKQVNQIAGDFQSVTDYQIEQIESSVIFDGKKLIEERETTILKPFAQKRSNKLVI